jgi:transcriptional regulator with XRE-family HTH domain
VSREAGGRGFGRHVRTLRKARGLTQDALAERCGLSTDTIRRLEQGSFSPSLNTLRKLAGGLDLLLSTLFEGYELDSGKWNANSPTPSRGGPRACWPGSSGWYAGCSLALTS